MAPGSSKDGRDRRTREDAHAHLTPKLVAQWVHVAVCCISGWPTSLRLGLWAYMCTIYVLGPIGLYSIGIHACMHVCVHVHHAHLH